VFDELKVGSVTPMKSMTVVYGDRSSGEVTLSYKKPKGKRYVLMLLGTENDDGTEPLDCFDVMDKLGWKMKEKK
jgi:hypothetical protein